MNIFTNSNIQELNKGNNHNKKPLHINVKDITYYPYTPEITREIEYYRVEPGDSLYSIANRYNTTVEGLVELNKYRGLKADNLIFPGYNIKVKQYPKNIPIIVGEKVSPDIDKSNWRYAGFQEKKEGIIYKFYQEDIGNNIIVYSNKNYDTTDRKIDDFIISNYIIENPMVETDRGISIGQSKEYVYKLFTPEDIKDNIVKNQFYYDFNNIRTTIDFDVNNKVNKIESYIL